MPWNGSFDPYERQQAVAIEDWKNRPPSVFGNAVGYALKPLAWAFGQVVPPSAVEGALRGADWLARQTLFEERIFRDAGVKNIDDLRALNLRQLDALGESFHGWAIGYAVVQGGATGAAGLTGIAVDIPLLLTLTLRTVRGVGACYGYVSDDESEQHFVRGIIAAAGANSVAEKTAALLFLRELQVTLLRQTFKSMAAKAAEQIVGKEAAIVALRNLARQLGVNLTKRKMLQGIPLIGSAVGALTNYTFIDDVAIAARRSYQQRWLGDRYPATIEG
jgi:EcsC protein family